MKNLTFKFLVYLYSYYRTGNTAGIAYYSTIIAFLAVLLFHFMTFACIFIWDENTILLLQIPKWQRFILFSVFIILPFYLLINYLFPEAEILKQLEKEPNLKKGSLYAFGYVVFSIALFIITLLTVKGVIF